MTTLPAASSESRVPESLAELANAVLLVGFEGTVAPDWLRRRIGTGLGGVCLYGFNVHTPAQTALLNRSLLAERADLIISVDEEAGDVTRIDARSGSRFPGNAALGRVDDVELTEITGFETASLLAANGFNLNLAPCADLADDPNNPVIGTRAFGSDPVLAARHTAAFIRGHQLAGVSACAKHFPGHGGTSADTHRQRAIIDRSLAELSRTAMVPFRAAIEAGVDSVMMGHLIVPQVDARPASISRAWITDVLRGELGYRGAVVTDALEMSAISADFGLVEGAVRALVAGADLLCLGADEAVEHRTDRLQAAIFDAVRSGRLPEARLRSAAARAAHLVRRDLPLLRTDNEDEPEVSATSLAVARKALQLAGSSPGLRSPTVVLRLQTGMNAAVGNSSWGPASVLSRPGLSVDEMVLTKFDPLPDRLTDAGSVVVVTRDRHRHHWMQRTLDAIRQAQPSAVLVEMGLAGVVSADGPALATFGASRANAQAAADQLCAGWTGG